jgi:hypothetical protein
MIRIKSEIEALQAELSKLEKKAQRDENEIRHSLTPLRISFEGERRMLDRAFRTLSSLAEKPDEEMFRRVGSQVDSLVSAPRDEFGAMVGPVEGALVGLPPTLQSTTPSVRGILENVVEDTVVKANEKRRRETSGDDEGRERSRRRILMDYQFAI